MRPASKKTIMKMREAYEKTIRKTSTENLRKKFPDRPGIEEAASTWVSRKDLDAFLTANNANGLRIYYGCYPDSTQQERPDYTGLHNLILVATKDSVTPQNPTTQNSVDLLKDADVSTSDTDYKDMAATDSDLCPPICPPPPPPPPPPAE